MNSTRTKRPGLSREGFSQLKDFLHTVGLNFAVWDAAAEAIEPFAPTERFCQTVCNAPGGCPNFSRDLARSVVAKGAPARNRTPIGCCVLAVPIRRRRRMLGAATACFPVRQMMDDEHLARLCEWLRLDREVVESIAADAIRCGEEQSEDFLRLLDWVCTREHARCVTASELETLSLNLTNTYEELSLLYRISGSTRVTQEPHEFLQNICNELLEVMNVASAVAFVSAHPPAITEDLVVISGEAVLNEEQVRILTALSIAPKFRTETRPILDNKFHASPECNLAPGLNSLIAVPLVTGGGAMAVLMALNKSDGDFDSIELKLITAVAAQASVFLANNRLYSDLQELLMGVLHALTATIDAKDPYTCGHSQRVALISRRLAQEKGFSSEKVRAIYLAGLLHDIGKIGVPEAILCKEGKLTSAEYEDIKRHPAIGANILGGIRQLDDVIVAILNHHERPDGKGYPHGVKGNELPIEGMILGLADGFDAMTSDRTYRNAMPLDAAVDEIRRNAGAQFDPALVQKLLSIDLQAFMTEIHAPAKGVFPLGVPQELKR